MNQQAVAVTPPSSPPTPMIAASQLARPFRFFVPIGGKITFMTLSLMIAATVPIAVKTSSLFKEISGKREEESNRSNANSRAAEINGLLESYVEKLSIIGTLRLKETVDGTAKLPTAASNVILQRDTGIVSFQIYKHDEKNQLQEIGYYGDTRYLKEYKLSEDYLKGLAIQRPFPIEAVFGGQPILRNRSMIGGAPLVTMGVPVAKDAVGRVTHVAIADFPLKVLQRGFAKQSERMVYLVDKDGGVLAHPDEKIMLEGANFSHLPIVKAALSSKVNQGQLKYQNPKRKNEFFISAFAKCLFDLAVISEAPESVILEPANMVQRQVYYIASLVIFIGIFVVWVFSQTLTRPIESLVRVAGEIATGNFDVIATNRVHSKDEVEKLAWAFDGMTSGLRERDKVKNLFNKFHGSSVTDDLLQGGNVALGGSRKRVAVFFSDIRGFTAFSENKTPEEVVNMLNEYFSAMVKVIYAHQGIVDKFIGDAIMAIWGAPKSTGNDAYEAVMACIEMRKSLDELNKIRIARGDVPIKIGMGLHSGDAISGTVGSDDRMEYTVIGDTVNMASRIESSTKAFGTDLLLSEDIAGQVKSQFILEEAGSAEVKGKAEPLKFFKVRGYIDAEGQRVEVKTEWSDYEAEKSEKVKVQH